MGEDTRHRHWGHIILWLVVAGLIGYTWVTYQQNHALVDKVHAFGNELAVSGLLDEQQSRELSHILDLLPQPPEQHSKRRSHTHTTAGTGTGTHPSGRSSSSRRSGHRSGGSSPSTPLPPSPPACTFDPPGKATGVGKNGKCPPGKVKA